MFLYVPSLDSADVQGYRLAPSVQLVAVSFSLLLSTPLAAPYPWRRCPDIGVTVATDAISGSLHMPHTPTLLFAPPLALNID